MENRTFFNIALGKRIFVLLSLCAAIISLGACGESKPKVDIVKTDSIADAKTGATNVEEEYQGEISYSIIKRDSTQGSGVRLAETDIYYKVEIADKYTKSVIDNITKEIAEKENIKPNLICLTIDFYLEGESKDKYGWATTHWDWDAGRVISDIYYVEPDAEGYYATENTPFYGGEVLGKWTNKLGVIIVLFEKDGKYYAVNYFLDSGNYDEPEPLRKVKGNSFKSQERPGESLTIKDGLLHISFEGQHVETCRKAGIK